MRHETARRIYRADPSGRSATPPIRGEKSSVRTSRIRVLCGLFPRKIFPLIWPDLTSVNVVQSSTVVWSIIRACDWQLLAPVQRKRKLVPPRPPARAWLRCIAWCSRCLGDDGSIDGGSCATQAQRPTTTPGVKAISSPISFSLYFQKAIMPETATCTYQSNAWRAGEPQAGGYWEVRWRGAWWRSAGRPWSAD
jgi:hypothetical protein